MGSLKSVKKAPLLKNKSVENKKMSSQIYQGFCQTSHELPQTLDFYCGVAIIPAFSASWLIEQFMSPYSVDSAVWSCSLPDIGKTTIILYQPK